MRRVFALLSLLFVCSVAAWAQTTIKVQAPNIVGLDEQFKISFVVSGEHAPSDFSWEASDDFELVWGPQKGTSSSVSIINGKTTKSQQTTYTYILMPKKKGVFTLSAAVATVKGKKISSNEPHIEVVADDSSAKSGSSSNPSSQRQTASISSEDIFIRFSFSKNDVVVGEPITASLKFYQKVNVAGFENVRFPEFNGFWSQETYAPSSLEFQRETVNGKIYETALIRTWTLIPQQSGEITIDPAELVCLVNIRMPNSSTGSFFDSFFQDDYQTIRKRVTTEAVKVKVNPLPAGAPDSFAGGVGKYSLTAELNRDNLKTHDAASLIVTIKGSGNTALLEAPKINLPPDFESYDVKVSEVPGGKQFEYPFIPRSHGDFIIEPVEYTYLDISTRRYVTLHSEAIKLLVAKGAESSASNSGQIISTPSQKDVRSLNEDIRYIKTALPVFAVVDSSFVGSVGFWAVIIGLFVLAVVAYFALASIAARRADVVGSKNRAALKMARKRLSAAEGFLAKNLYSAFYEELHRALLGYVGDKFNMDASELSKENIAERFAAVGVREAVAKDFVGLLDACEFARYAPSTGSEAMNEHYTLGLSLITMIEQGMKRKGNVGAAALVLALLLIPGSLSANPADSLWTAGVNAYTQADWQGARESWQAIEDEGLVSWELYYNIGNAYYREQDFAYAILYYERALRLKPSSSDVRSNLDLARSKTMDKIESVPEFFLRSWMRYIRSLMDTTAWSLLGFVLLALGLSMAMIFHRGSSVAARRTGFVLAIVALLLSLMSLRMAFAQKAELLDESKAIVIRPVVSAKSSPSETSAKDLFILHEGTKLTILDALGQWSNVELSDGRQGWVKTVELEII